MHRTWVMTAVAALLLAAPAAAQLCLGRSLPGEATVSMDVGVAGDVASRLAAGDQLDNGLGWRVGVLGAGDTGPTSLEFEAVHGELTWSLPLGSSVAACPGASVYRTFVGGDESVTVLDLFASFAARLTPERRVELVPFVTPRILIGSDRSFAIADYVSGDPLSSHDPGTYYASSSSTLAGLTGGVGVLFGRFGLQASVSAATPFDDARFAQALLGFGPTYRFGR